MGFKDKVMNSLGFQDQNDDEYQYEDDYQYEDQPAYEEEPKQQRGGFSGFGFSRAANTNNEDEADYDNGFSGMRVVLLQPGRFEEALNIADYLLDDKVVVFDLQECDVDTAINIVNFVSGAIYALSGSIQKINNRGAIFVAVPPSVSMDNELNVGAGGDYSVNFADWVNRTHGKNEFMG